MVATKTTRIQWTDEEKRRILERGREIRLEHPGLSPRALIVRAQEVLPEGRRREHVKNDPPYRFEWFTGGLGPRGKRKGATPPPVAGAVPASGTGPGPEGARKARVFWSNRELEQILTRAREIRDSTGLQNGRSLIDRAQRDVLPEARWRARGTMQGDRIDWMLARMAEWPPLVVPTDEARLAAQAEAARLSLLAYAYPPVPPPAPPPPDPLEAVRALGTRDLLAVVAERLFCTVSGGIAMIAEALDEMRQRQAEDHDLILEVLASQEPRQEAPSVRQVIATVREPEPPQQPPGRPQTRPRICLIGGDAEWGEGVVRAVAAVAEVTHEPKSDLARNKGFRNYDLVLTTPIAGHDATKRAKNDIGHQNVIHVPHTGAARVAEEIRKIVAKRAVKASPRPTLNGAAHAVR